MKRYWVSWWSGYYADEGCTRPPFQTWASGQRDRADGKDELSHCAVIDASDPAEVWVGVRRHFPDYEPRFCDEVEADFRPGDRFPGFENRTKLTAD